MLGMSSPSLIRLANKQDAAQIRDIYAPFVTQTPVSFEVEPPTVAEMERRVTETLQQLPWLVCENAGQVVGYVYASLHNARAAYMWSADVTVYVHQQCHRSGIGKALYSSLFAILTLQGFYHAYAGITLPNAASVGLHESFGFQPVGIYEAVGYKFGAWHSVGWWQLALRELAASPSPPLSLKDVQARAKWQTALNTGLPFLKL